MRAHQLAGAGNTVAVSGEASPDEEADRRLFEELERAAAHLYREGCGDGAAAVDEAIRRLRANPAR